MFWIRQKYEFGRFKPFISKRWGTFQQSTNPHIVLLRRIMAQCINSTIRQDYFRTTAFT